MNSSTGFRIFQKVYAADCKTKFIFDCSQHGETAKLVKLLAESGLRHRIIVDVGARGREDRIPTICCALEGGAGCLLRQIPG